MDGINGFEEYGAVPAVDLAWMMFASSGMPCYYMLYTDLLYEKGVNKERSILD